MQNKDTGFLGENIGAAYLQEKGYEILARNWRYKHLEIDLIASYNGHLHIVEVKTRTSLFLGIPNK